MKYLIFNCVSFYLKSLTRHPKYNNSGIQHTRHLIDHFVRKLVSGSQVDFLSLPGPVWRAAGIGLYWLILLG